MCKFCNTEYLSLAFDLHEYNNVLLYREHRFCYHCGRQYDSKLLEFSTKKEYQEPTSRIDIRGGIGNKALNQHYFQVCRNASLYNLHNDEFVFSASNFNDWRNVTCQMLNI